MKNPLSIAWFVGTNIFMIYLVFLIYGAVYEPSSVIIVSLLIMIYARIVSMGTGLGLLAQASEVTLGGHMVVLKKFILKSEKNIDSDIADELSDEEKFVKEKSTKVEKDLIQIALSSFFTWSYWCIAGYHLIVVLM